MIYYLLFIPYFLASILSIDIFFRRALRPVAFISIFIMVFFAGTQYGIGDYYNYLSIYKGYSFSDFAVPFFTSYEHGGTGHEFIFSSLAVALQSLGFPYGVFFILLSVVTVGGKLLFLYKFSPYFFISLVVYLAFIYLKDMTQLRGAMASSIIIWSTIFIVRNKPFYFILSIFFASGFHVFSIVALPLYWICISRFSSSVVVLGLIVSYFLSFHSSFVQFFLNYADNDTLGYIYRKVEGYYHGDRQAEVNPFGSGSFFYVFVILFCIYRKEKIFSYSPLSWYAFIYFAYGFILYILFFDLSIIAYRSLEVFSHLALAFILAVLVKVETKFMRLFWWSLSVIYASFFAYVKINDVAPYRSVLFSSY
ncbi:EpsG family protein [Marinobacter sp.]|uniref:EpsG family protein n=1 Tax=Marinobacter sp. TaxID=50741 RepID=UPI00384C770C